MSEVLKKLAPGYFQFNCPACGDTHQIWTEEAEGFKFGWGFNGDMVKPTFTPSLNVEYPRGAEYIKCHSFITDGQIKYESDSSHAMKGQTTPLPPIQ